MFFRSMTEPEQRHIVSAFTFELSKVETVAIGRACSAIFWNIRTLAAGVEGALRDAGPGRKDQTLCMLIDLRLSPGLSLVKKAEPTLAG